MTKIDDLKKQLEVLQSIKSSGVLSITTDGFQTRYRDMAELLNAERDLIRNIAAIEAAPGADLRPLSVSHLKVTNW